MDADAPRIHVFTFKDGLLARLAHDLRLTLERFELVAAGERVTGRFWPDSLRVDGALRRGRIVEGELSAGDREKILGNMRVDVLDTVRHPEILLDVEVARDGDAFAVRGRLTMVGVTRPVELGLTRAGGRVRGEIALTPSRWGIRPYRALAGAIRLQDRVLVRVDVPLAQVEAGRIARGMGGS